MFPKSDVTIHASDIDHAWDKLKMVTKNSGDRHALFYFDDRLILRTKRSMGTGKLGGNIPHLIRQQMKLNEKQFAELIACPLKRDDYIEILKEKGYIEIKPTEDSKSTKKKK